MSRLLSRGVGGEEALSVGRAALGLAGGTSRGAGQSRLYNGPPPFSGG